MEKIIKEVNQIFEKRLHKRLNSKPVFSALETLELERFYIAGGALLKEEPNDYDLFPITENNFKIGWDKEKESMYKVWETVNSVSFLINNVKIQACKFHNKSLEELVERFDFTHCKVGAEIERQNIATPSGKRIAYVIKDLYISQDHLRYRLLGYSEYCGVQPNDYPLSSLLRVFKYYKRGYIRSSYDVIFKILEAFLERGYDSQLDFERQLRGIDLSPEDAEQIDENRQALMHIYYLLTGKTIDDWKVIFNNSLKIGDKK